MLHKSSDMPKIQILTDPASIEKYGGSRMYFAPPLDYDRIIRQIPRGRVMTVGQIRALLEAEGHTVLTRGRTRLRFYVQDYEQSLFTPEETPGKGENDRCDPLTP